MLHAFVLTESDPGAILAQLNTLLARRTRRTPLHHHGAGVPRRALAHPALRQPRSHDGLPARASGRLKAELAQHGRAARALRRGELRIGRGIRAREGDIVALFTDGIVESVDEEAYYGADGALKDLRRPSPRTSSRHRPACVPGRAGVRPGPQADDMTMVVCKVGAGPQDRATPAS